MVWGLWPHPQAGLPRGVDERVIKVSPSYPDVGVSRGASLPAAPWGLTSGDAPSPLPMQAASYPRGPGARGPTELPANTALTSMQYHFPLLAPLMAGFSSHSRPKNILSWSLPVDLIAWVSPAFE